MIDYFHEVFSGRCRSSGVQDTGAEVTNTSLHTCSVEREILVFQRLLEKCWSGMGFDGEYEFRNMLLSTLELKGEFFVRWLILECERSVYEDVLVMENITV